MKNMKLILIILSACSPRVVNQSSWQSPPVIADGDLSEWETPLQHYDSDAKCSYSISNDKQNLYLCLNVTDQMTQEKILRAGMDVWLDPSGKKKRQVGISFPLGSAQQMSREEMGEQMAGQGGRPDVTAMKQKFLAEQTIMQLYGFKSSMNGLMPIRHAGGISVKIDWDSNNTMVYEAVIPFNTFYKEVLSPSDSTSVFGFSVVVKALPMPRFGPGAGMRPSGGMGMPGGGMSGRSSGGGRPGGAGMGDKQALFTESSFRTKFKLTAK